MLSLTQRHHHYASFCTAPYVKTLIKTILEGLAVMCVPVAVTRPLRIPVALPFLKSITAVLHLSVLVHVMHTLDVLFTAFP